VCVRACMCACVYMCVCVCFYIIIYSACSITVSNTTCTVDILHNYLSSNYSYFFYIELYGLFNVLLVCVMKEISCSYRGNKKHYRAFGGKCLSTMENGSQNFLSYKHQDFLLSKISEPKIQEWGIESCDWPLNNVCVFGSFCLQYV